MRKTEEAIEQTEAALAALEAQMAEPAVATNAPRLLELDREAAALRDKLEELYNRWEALS